MTRILSGVQPTGNIHLGNYLGAIKNWVGIQHNHESLFMLADLHAITIFQEPKNLSESILKTAALYVACGIDVSKSVIFQQSRVSAHSELAWILNCITPMGWLNRMTQYKSKSENHDNNLGLYSYPVLMAADILLYKATNVPVGDDQNQHLQLTRDVAGAFNRAYKQDYFVLPNPLIQPECSRVMSLDDGRSKMSKSNPSDLSRINLTDSDELIRKKLKKAKSDSYRNFNNLLEANDRPEAKNLIEIYSVLTGQSFESSVEYFSSKNWSSLKSEVGEAIIQEVSPIRQKFEEISQDYQYLKQILEEGYWKANEIASKNLKEIKQIVGLNY